MKWPWTKENPDEWTMEFSYIILNKETGDIKTKRFCVSTWTDVVRHKENFVLPDGYELIASPFHRFGLDIKDLTEFKSCGKLELNQMLYDTNRT